MLWQASKDGVLGADEESDGQVQHALALQREPAGQMGCVCPDSVACRRMMPHPLS